MNEVVQPFIFPKGELEERWKLRKFLEKIIILDKQNMFENLDAKTIKDVYEIESGKAILTSAAVSNFLYAGGYTKIETGSYATIQGSINFQTFNVLQPEAKMLLIHCMVDADPRTNACRRLLLAERNGQTVEVLNSDGDISIGGSQDWIKVWLEYFTISHFNPEQIASAKVKWKPDKRASIVTLHRFYCNVLRYYGKRPVTRKVFRNYLEQFGVYFKKGYANHTSGVLYAEGIWIPISNEDQQKSIEMGYAVISQNEEIVDTPYGTKPLHGLLDQKENIYRRFGYDSQEPQEEEIDEEETPARETVLTGREVEIPETPQDRTEEEFRLHSISQRTTGITESNSVQYETEDESDENQYSEVEITERTMEESEDDPMEVSHSYAELRAKDQRRKPKAFVDYDPLDTAAAARFLNGKSDPYLSDRDTGEFAESDIVTIESILNALRVANNIEPITVNNLDAWLSRMRTSIEELQITPEELIARL